MGNIIDTQDYKLQVDVKEYRPNEYQVDIQKFVKDQGWMLQKFFLTKEQLLKLNSALEV